MNSLKKFNIKLAQLFRVRFKIRLIWPSQKTRPSKGQEKTRNKNRTKLRKIMMDEKTVLLLLRLILLLQKKRLTKIRAKIRAKTKTKTKIFSNSPAIIITKKVIIPIIIPGQKTSNNFGNLYVNNH